MSYANKLSSFELSFLLRATTAHSLPGDDQHGGLALTRWLAIRIADCRYSMLRRSGQGCAGPIALLCRFTPAMGWASLPFRPAAPGRNARGRAYFLFVPALRVRPGSVGGPAGRFFAAHPIPG